RARGQTLRSFLNAKRRASRLAVLASRCVPLRGPGARRGRQHAVQPQVVRFLAVLLGPVSHRDQDRRRAGKWVRPEQLNRLIELRIVQLRERRLTELERLPQPGDERVLAGGGVDRGALRRSDARDLTAQQIVTLVDEVVLNLREANLRRSGSVAVLVRRNRL